MVEPASDNILNLVNELYNNLDAKDKIINEQALEIARLKGQIDEKIKKRIDIAIRLLIKLFGTDDYEINYIIGILNGQRQIDFDLGDKENE